MASWKRHFRIVTDGAMSPVNGSISDYSMGYLNQQSQFAFRNYQSHLPDVYRGHPNRIDRYSQFEGMDSDTEVSAALDIIAQFCTQVNEDTKTAFDIHFHDKATDNEIEILKEQLSAWNKINEFDKTLFKIFRSTIKYGDQIFVRDPETYKWHWSEMNCVTKVIVNESKGKEPEVYYIKDINPNLQNSTITKSTNPMDSISQSPFVGGSRNFNPGSQTVSDSRFGASSNEFPVDAKHVVHISLTEGMDPSWPFGVSILENIFKVFKQMEMLESALLIYRVQRAPERRVFKIDVGNMPAHMQMSFLERVKNEVNQRRIPSQTGGGMNIMDAAYNPMAINEDYFFPVGLDGRGSSVEVLPGGQNLGEIDDLKYFQNKMFRGLRIPSSYLPTGKEDGDRTYTDGKVTTALIQEYCFNEYCKRLQKYVCSTFDDEFKLFLKWRGFNLDNSLFEIRFNEPLNFSSYRDIELSNQRIQAFNSVKDTDFLSKRFILKKYLGLTEIEIAENEQLWHEERGDPEGPQTSGDDMRSVGITPGGITGDLDAIGDLEAGDGMDGMGDMGMGGDPGQPGVNAGGPAQSTPSTAAPAGSGPSVST